jgi:hypothetical protein
MRYLGTVRGLLGAGVKMIRWNTIPAMVEGLSEAQIVDRMGAAKLHAERTGLAFVEAQRVVNAL